MTTDWMADTSAAGTRAACSSITAGRSRAAAAATCSTVAARASAARSWKELRVTTAIRSASSTTPSTRPVGETTGRWRIPRSSMSSSASPPDTSAGTV